jgi:glycosyltransferase involved in cell wall biosynthesis
MAITSSNALLWVTPKWPFPAEDGARRATVVLLKSLAQAGVDIHLCSIVSESESADPQQAIRELGVRGVSLIRRLKPRPWTHARNLLLHPLLPLTLAPFSTRVIAREFERELGEHLRDRAGRDVVFDGLHAAGWIGHVSAAILKPFRMIYRAHNVETQLWVQAADRSRNPVMKLLFKYQTALMRSFESHLSRRSVLIATVSEDDAAGFRQLCGGDKLPTRNIPIGVIGASRGEVPAFPQELSLLFIGRLDWPPNKQGLAWFLENVWPEAVRERPELRLTVAGAGDGRWLEPFAGTANVRFLGRVPEVDPLYRESIASLVPVFFGSGTRVKAIEASSFGRPCISTAIGVEGIGLDPSTSYFRAESREEWLAALRGLTVTEAERRGRVAHRLISESFDPAKIAARFIEALR